MTTYGAHGLRATVPAEWGLRIFQRSSPQQAPGARGDLAAAPASIQRPVLHASSIALSGDIGDFGGGAIEHLAADDIFLALVEYEPELAGHGLFERQGMPTLAPSRFATNRLFRALPELSASQQFFTVGGRAFCLYAVVGSHSRRMSTVPRAAQVAASFRVTPLGRTS